MVRHREVNTEDMVRETDSGYRDCVVEICNLGGKNPDKAGHPQHPDEADGRDTLPILCALTACS